MKGHIKTIIYFIIFLFISSIGYASPVTLRWDANIESNLAGYKIYYRNDSRIYDGIGIEQGDSPIIITILDQNDPNYMNNIDPEFTLTGLDFDAYNYYFVVTAYDSEIPIQESGYSNEVNTIDFNIPTMPQNLTATVININRIDLNWDVSRDNIEVIGYRIYRNGIIIDNVVINNYSDITVSPSINYNYSVTALDIDGHESEQSNIVSAMTNDGTPPSIPQNLEVLTISSTTIELEWEKSIDNIGVIGYDIYRDMDLIASIIGEISNLISYIDIELIPSTSYIYSIVAWDAANNRSKHSDSLNVMTTTSDSSGGGSSSGGCFINTLKGNQS